MDNLTPAQRKRTMASVQAKNTTPELVVRRIVHALGFRYRLHSADLPGKPDIILKSRRKVIFVHGCFWHRHSCGGGRSMPATNQEYWLAKFERNRARDSKTRAALRKAGWSVLVIWECETRPARLQQLQSRLMKFLS
jgi:DNA mismatch endonuclease (patch repair protein)